jgi:hypothetical protein
MRTKTLTVTVLLAAFACSWIAAADAEQSRRPKNDPFDDMPGVFSIGPMVGALGNLAEGLAAMKEAYAEFDREIQAARKDYWAKYPDRPGFAQAEATFAQKLYAKDLSYLTLARVDGRCQGGDLSRYKNAMGTALNMAGGGEVDGGIASGAGSAFCTWVNAARGRDVGSAMKLPEYATYRRARDWAELVRAGRVTFASPYDLLASKDPRWYALGLIWGHNEYGIKRDALVEGIFPDILQRAKATFETLAKTHGRENVLGIARKVMEAPKRPPDPKIVKDGLMDTGFLHLANPQALGCVTLYAYVDECFFQLLLPETKPAAAPEPVRHTGRGAARPAAPPVMPPATPPPAPTTPPVPAAPDSSVSAPAARPTTAAAPAGTTKPPEQKETTSERRGKIDTDVAAKTHSIVADLRKQAEGQQAQAAAASQTAAQPSAGAQAQSADAPAGPDWQPCGGDLKSGASQTVVPVEFVNTSKQPRRLIWFDFAGAKVVAGTLQPGQRAPMQTYTTHAWMIAEASDRCMGTLVISKAGTIEIH